MTSSTDSQPLMPMLSQKFVGNFIVALRFRHYVLDEIFIEQLNLWHHVPLLS